jgi:hypothetical protein
MAEVPSWRLTGDWFDVCRCRVPCGCTFAMGFFIDERADERQRESLQAIFGGEAGGWPGTFAELIDDMRGIEYAPIEFEIDDDLARWRVEVPG